MSRFVQEGSVGYSVKLGILFGVIAFLGMLLPIQVTPGVIIDSRIVVVASAGLFGGPISAAIAATFPVIYRVILGGVGTVPGVGAIIGAAVIGVAASWWWRKEKNIYPVSYLLLFGFVISVQSLLWTFLLPPEIAFSAFKLYFLPVCIAYPIGVALLGTLLVHQIQRHMIFKQLIIERETVDRQAKELRDFAQRMSAHIENTPLGVIEWSLGFKVRAWNSAAESIFGFSKKEALGKSAMDLIVPEEVRELVEPIWEDLISGNGGTKATNENITKTGQPIVCEWYNTTLKDKQDNVIGVASLVQDITDKINFEKERKKLQKSLQQSQKMEAVGTLAGGIAHDFNNILGAIIGYTEMAKDDSDPGSTVSEDLGKVLAASNRAKDLVQRILAFSRQGDTERTMFQPVTIVKETLNMLRPTLPATIEIVQDLEDNSGNILADPTQVNQIVMNLCTNAYHVMEKSGGVLEITLRSVQLSKYDLLHEPSIEPGDFIQLSVKDTGAGIPQEIKEKIFDPYFTTKDSGRGTGLGLSIVHGIVKSYGGFISLYSEVNKGTVFHVFLPSVPLNNEIVRTVEESIKDGSEKILFVDDDEILTDMGKNMLTRLGYDVTVTNSSFEALEIFQNEPEKFDLVITDQTMPNMTGADLARRFLQIRADIPIILCTGFSTIISEKKAREIGVKEFLMKPISKKEISGLIRKVLDETKEVGA